MHGSATVGWLLVALCAVAGASCVLRARGAGPGGRAQARGEAVMGFGMAAMAVPALWDAGPVPPVVPAWGFAGVFGTLLARELLMAARKQRGGARRGHAHHVVGAAAMLYMALTMAAGPSGPSGAAAPHHAGAGGIPVVTAALLGYFAGYVLWSGARLMPSAAGVATAGADRTAAGDDVRLRGDDQGPGPVAAPAGTGLVQQAGVAAGCRLTMATGMFAMLLTL
ncbi:DUF5134 domain-containing protein [Streptomyces albus subsp. chlorinus]|uniref:DUF5134 domain-containing protein n=1 Tax=Streptomyces albus TaxID=1888 RepID=UPI00156FE5AA|nr:DUF5134 domain-containing protein [Streptomyces albus]NSC25249.1 DUF5134 domain-containing protein [Streptomyces albus subsp. chlorinus]